MGRAIATSEVTGRVRHRPVCAPGYCQGFHGGNGFHKPGKDCLYLNVSTPTLPSGHGGHLPVLVWIHGGGLTEDAGRDYDGSKLAANGIVVVTINYRLGALGFLAHPALASRPGGPAGRPATTG